MSTGQGLPYSVGKTLFYLYLLNVWPFIARTLRVNDNFIRLVLLKRVLKKPARGHYIKVISDKLINDRRDTLLKGLHIFIKTYFLLDNR